MLPEQLDKKFLENIVQEKYLLLLTCFILYADLLLVRFTGKNILFMPVEFLDPQQIVLMTVFAVSFGLLMVPFSRFCRDVTCDFGHWLLSKVASRGYYENLEDKKRALEENYVEIRKLEVWAMKHDNSVTVQKIKDRWNYIQNQYVTKNYYFFLSVAIVIELGFLPQGILRYLGTAVFQEYAQWPLVFLFGTAIYMFFRSVIDVPYSMFYIRADKDCKITDNVLERKIIDNNQQLPKALSETTMPTDSFSRKEPREMLRR